jgi:general secretion pathway protein G
VTASRHKNPQFAMICSGMTLIEILAVVVILGLLAVTLTVGISGRISKARHEISRTQIAQLMGAIEAFRLEKRQVPTATEGLAALSSTPNAAYFMEPGKLLDPWGKAYLYLVPGPNDIPFEILTYGADGQPGGEGENADISSSNLSGQTVR